MHSTHTTAKSGGLKSYQDRVSKLSEKLSGLQVNMEEGKTRRVEEMESWIMHIDTKVLGWHEDNNKKFNNIKE